MMTNVENVTVYVFQKIQEGQIDFDSFSGQHFIEWCQERNYENESFKVFARRFGMKPNLLEEMEQYSFKYRNFAKKYLVQSEQQDFLAYLHDQHDRYFKNQHIVGAER